jgi:hypothetical protein
MERANMSSPRRKEIDWQAVIDQMWSKKTEDRFDEAERVQHNLDWYAKEKARKEQKRRIHNAICGVQGKSRAEQQRWLEDNPLLAHAVFTYLDPALQLKLIREEEDAALQAVEEHEAEERALRRDRIDAATFLLRTLSHGRPVPAQIVNRKATEAGISKRSLDRAKAKLGIRSRLIGFGRAGRWFWLLPKHGHSA